MDTVEDCFNVQVDHYVRINFNSFVQIVNAVGGVDIDITEMEAKALNWEVPSNSMLIVNHVDPGLNHFDGYTALQYARLRKIDNDWHRIERQRTVIQAVLDQIQNASVTELDNLLNTMLPLVQTNFTKTEIAALLVQLPGFLGCDVKQLSMPLQGTYGVRTGMDDRLMYDPDWYVNTTALQDFLYNDKSAEEVIAATPETAEAAEPEATPTPAPTQAPTAVVNTAQLPLLEDPDNSPLFIDPVPDYKYISRFKNNSHRGDDLCAAPGTDVLAAADGVVVQADEHYSWGNFVVIDHGTNGEGHSWRTLYAHLQSYAVEVGQHVTQGQIIGYVGNTGQSTSNHCHFEVYVDNILTSPRWFTAYHGEGDSAEPTDEERQELIDRCVDAKLYDAMHTMDEALDGQGAQTVIFSLPLVLSDDVRMSSTFAQNRTGVDLAAPEGTTVLAAADGTVTEYDYNEDDGYYLVLYHGMDDGASWQTRYSHLGSVKVQVGQQVVQGQEIAACGSTGASTGPHLHWEVLKNSEPVDPQTVCELLSTL